MSSTTNTTQPPPTLPEKPRRSVFSRHLNNPQSNGVNGVNAPNGYAAEQGTTGYSEHRRGFMTGFSFARWVRLHIIDLLCMAAMGAVGLGVYEADPAPSRSFPVL